MERPRLPPRIANQHQEVDRLRRPPAVLEGPDQSPADIRLELAVRCGGAERVGLLANPSSSPATRPHRLTTRRRRRCWSASLIHRAAPRWVSSGREGSTFLMVFSARHPSHHQTHGRRANRIASSYVRYPTRWAAPRILATHPMSGLICVMAWRRVSGFGRSPACTGLLPALGALAHVLSFARELAAAKISGLHDTLPGKRRRTQGVRSRSTSSKPMMTSGHTAVTRVPHDGVTQRSHMP